VTRTELERLARLARLYGIQTSYADLDGRGRGRAKSREALVAVLRCLGAPVSSVADCHDALRAARQESWRRGVEPVAVAWEGEEASLEVRLPDPLAGCRVTCHWQLEGGEERSRAYTFGHLPVLKQANVEGVTYVARKLKLPGLPRGYHRLRLETGAGSFDSTVLSAPRVCYHPRTRQRTWGVFLPLYALHSKDSWGAGDLGDLQELLAWTAKQGGGVVGTLPLLPAFLDRPFEPSPYSPISRLYWNEFYVDVTRVPELKNCREAQKILRSPAFQRKLGAWRSDPMVDYRGQMKWKRKVLEILCRRIFSAGSSRRRALQRFVARHPALEDYARFRATCERKGTPWSQWRDRLRQGDLRAGDYDEKAKQYHVYAQWLAHEQLDHLSARAAKLKARLYLDLPLGVHSAGFDVWRNQDLFALEVSGGAPPDALCARGQDWGFAPLHARRMRQDGHQYFRAILAHHLKHAGFLRIDHVMGLHRLYWIPKGFPADQGVYVQYPAAELYAVLSLESHRHQAVVVGENLGTVPPAVNTAMKRHNVRKMYVVQYGVRRNRRQPLPPVPVGAVASLNTHDMPPFKAFLDGLDIEDRRGLGLLTRSSAKASVVVRKAVARYLEEFLRRKGLLKSDGAEAAAILKACVEYLSRSPADLLLLNLEDLWSETSSQNVPSTTTEHANWKRKARFRMEDFKRLPQVLEVLARVAEWRGK
jgi:4-alpha-glucanotransferase